MGPQLPNARAFNHQERVQHLRERKKSVLIYSNPTPQGHWIEDSKKIESEMQEKALGFS